MAPIVHGLEAQYAGRITFSYLDVDDPRNTDFERALGFRYQPEFYLLDAGGNVIQKWVGPVQAAAFVEAFEAVLGE